jgi:hypothetical protein
MLLNKLMYRWWWLRLLVSGIYLLARMQWPRVYKLIMNSAFRRKWAHVVEVETVIRPWLECCGCLLYISLHLQRFILIWGLADKVCFWGFLFEEFHISLQISCGSCGYATGAWRTWYESLEHMLISRDQNLSQLLKLGTICKCECTTEISGLCLFN